MTNPYTMCSAAGTSRFLPTRPAARYAGFKRTLAVYDPAAAAEQRSDAGALLPSPVAGEPINAVPLAARPPNGKAMRLGAAPALVPLPVAGEPINVVPLAACAPNGKVVPLADRSPNGKAMPLAAASALVPLPMVGKPINVVPLAARAPNGKAVRLAARARNGKAMRLGTARASAPQENRVEPPWVRAPGGLLWTVGFRVDIPVHFVDEKVLTATDVDPHQNRFRLPSEPVMDKIRPLLSHVERVASNLVHKGPLKPRLLKLPAVPGEKKARKKRKGKDHGGLPVLLTEYHAGVRELQLSRWDSSGVCIVKGEGYMDFINRCSFKVGDVVEIWAIKEKNFHLFGVNMCRQNSLCIFLAKKGEILPPPPRDLPPAAAPSNALVPYGGDETAQDDAPKLLP